MSASGRGGKRSGAGRKPKAYDIHAIIAECSSVRQELFEKQSDRAWDRYWSRFEAYKFVKDRQSEMEKWSAEQRRAALGRTGSARRVLVDVRAMLRERTGPNERKLGGTHSIVVPRLYGVRRPMFALVAKRLQRRYGWRISARRIERVWKRFNRLK